jgi:hypothetical protein
VALRHKVDGQHEQSGTAADPEGGKAAPELVREGSWILQPEYVRVPGDGHGALEEEVCAQEAAFYDVLPKRKKNVLQNW